MQGGGKASCILFSLELPGFWFQVGLFQAVTSLVGEMQESIKQFVPLTFGGFISVPCVDILANTQGTARTVCSEW